jgi:hypothetical protein
MTHVWTGLIAGAVITAVLIAIAWIAGQFRMRGHRGVTRDQFVDAFAGTPIPPEIPAAVYDYYKAEAVFKEYSISPEDDYNCTLSKGDEDIDDDARFILKRLGLKIPGDYAAVRAETQIRTLRDMVHWLDWVRTHQPSDFRQ